MSVCLSFYLPTFLSIGWYLPVHPSIQKKPLLFILLLLLLLINKMLFMILFFLITMGFGCYLKLILSNAELKLNWNGLDKNHSVRVFFFFFLFFFCCCCCCFSIFVLKLINNFVINKQRLPEDIK
mgnify:CR=1 FL=1